MEPVGIWTRAMVVAGLAVAAAVAQRNDAPQPRVVDPGPGMKAPADAAVLFGGGDLAGWTARDGQPARCAVREGVMVCATGAGDVVSKEKFRDAQIHLEFNVPVMRDQKGQLRGNSGVYLQGKYEIQILDSFENPTYATGACAALYGQAAPLVNASRRPGEWQTYDILLRGPVCGSDGQVTQRATVTLLHNGVLVHDQVEIAASKGCEGGPLLLQDHSGFPGAPHTEMKFRNIWLRHLK